MTAAKQLPTEWSSQSLSQARRGRTKMAKLQTAAKRLRHKAQGWPRFLRPTLGKDGPAVNPEGGCALIPQISFIPFQSMLFEHPSEFILEGNSAVMLSLSSDVLHHSIEICKPDRKESISPACQAKLRNRGSHRLIQRLEARLISLIQSA